MKIILTIITLILALSEIAVFFKLKNYCNIHENEEIEQHKKTILLYISAMFIIGIAIAIVGFYILFIYKK